VGRWQVRLAFGQRAVGDRGKMVVMIEPGQDVGRLDVVHGLVAGAVRPPEDGPPQGATPEQLEVLAGRLGQSLPAALAAWLSVCNGAVIGPGGVFGQRPDLKHLDIPSALRRYPGWQQQGWIPVAGDGCGNYYILTPDGTVAFIDTMIDPDKITSRSGPDLVSFMTALLASDQAP
jgi:hypothetical protein